MGYEHLPVFREYDLRGLAEEELDDRFCHDLGLTLAAYFKERGLGRVLLGRDNRPSSPWIRDRITEGLTTGGCDVVDIGEVTTPLFYYARIHLDIDAGVMITASHNPPEYNGFKIARGPATIYGEEIQRLRRMLLEGAGKPAAFPGTVTTCDVTEAYLGMLAEKIKLERGLKVAVDCGNGTAGPYAVEFLRRLGCEVIPIYCDSDGRFPHHEPDPVRSANLRDLQATVLASRAELGLAFDGDGDRLGVVDEKAQIIWGDKLMVLFWREILAKHPGAVALIEVKCSDLLVEEVKRLGGVPVFTRTGHSLIKARMRELGALFAGEMSGHMVFADEYFGLDDAFYAAGRLLRILAASPLSLSAMLADLPVYYSTAETRIACPDAAKEEVVRQIKERFAATNEVIDVDGARIVFPDGWGLVRASNTQPVIVTRCEARTPEGLMRIKALLGEALAAHPAVGPVRWED
ncbi:MAG: phosphomannomutase/phosphoglucomutase [Firmicutes bacterium]|nr:phosphomannomutase/phosphoglucomutase [Bacillota bacterium]